MSWNDKVLTLNEIIQVKQRRGYACFYSIFFVFNHNSLVYHKTIKSIQFSPLSCLIGKAS